MKIAVEMIFNIGGDNAMCFSEANVPYRYNPVEVAIEEIIKKRREFSVNSSLVSVKVADVDVTNDVMAVAKDYIRRKTSELDSDLPF